MKLNSGFCLVIFFLLSSSCFTQNPVYKKYTMDDGLPSNIIYQITQDSKGYIWLATDKGASRFDGTRFENFSIENGLPDNEVLFIIHDKQQRVWFKSFSGPMSYYNGKVHNSSNTPWLKKLEFKRYPLAFTPISNGDILISLNYYLDLKIRDTTILNSDTIGCYEIVEKRDGRLLLIGNDQILENGRKIKILNLDRKQKWTPFCWYNKLEDILLIANDSGLYCYQHNEVKKINNSNLVNIENGCVIISDNEGYFWLTNFSTLYRFKINSNSSIEDVHTYMNGIAINNVFQDKDNNYWFATKGEGLMMVPSLNIKLFNKASGLDDNNITTALKADDNKIICGTLNGSVHTFNLKGEILKSENLYSNQIRKIIKDIDGRLFILSQNNLFEQQMGEIKKLSKVSNSYKSMVINAKGEVLIGGVNIIANYYKGKADVTILDIGVSRVYSLCEKDTSELWVGTEKGLFILKNKVPSAFQPSIKSFKGWIDDIRKTNDGEMLVTTRDSGLAVITNNKVEFINTKDGLQSNTCNSLFYDSISEKIYLGLNKGLSVIHFDKHKNPEIKNYNPSNGLFCGSIFSVSENDGEILLSTDHGLLVFRENHLNSAMESPKVYITRLEINNKSVDLKSNYTLTSDENNIRIVYGGISFRDATTLEYRYQLIPSDTGWNETKSRTVVYPDLQPGAYKFSVKVRIANGKWVNGNSSLNFTINKPYWATWWFRIMVVFIISIILYKIYRYQLRRKLEQQLAISADRARISSEMHDDLGSGLSKISLLSELINQNIPGGEMKPHLENISRSSKEMVEAMGGIIWSMNEKNDQLSNLIAYIRKYAMEFFENTSVRCIVVLPEHIPSVNFDGRTRRNIFLVIKEALHNVLKHSEANEVTITFNVVANSFSIDIADNGNGFDTLKLSEFGNGLLNMEKRMKEAGGKFSIENKEGTVIEISVPL